MSPILKRSIFTALLVGGILILINQWELIFSGQITTQLLVKMLITPVIPFCVSYISGTLASKALNKKVKQLKEVAKGNLTVEFGDQNGTDEADRGINKLLKSLRDNFASYFDTAYQLACTSGKLTYSSDELLKITNICTSHFEILESKFSQITSHENNSLENIEAVVKRSIIIKNNSETNIKAISELENLLEKVQAQLEKQNENIEKIGEFTKIISDIAFQSKILAFNATVEAQRAGLAGKGFSVVAAEVKKMSDLTDAEATRIGDLTKDLSNENNIILKSFSDSMLQMQNNKDQSFEIFSLIENQSESFKKISSASSESIKATEEGKFILTKVQNEYNKIPLLVNKTQESSRQLHSSSEILRKGISEYNSGFESKPVDVYEFLLAHIQPIVINENFQHNFSKKTDKTIKPKDVYKSLIKLSESFKNKGEEFNLEIIQGLEIIPSDVMTLAKDLYSKIQQKPTLTLIPEEYFKWKQNLERDLQPGDVNILIENLIKHLDQYTYNNIAA